MTLIAWGRRAHAGVDGFHVGVNKAQLEAAPVRRAADVVAAQLKTVVAIGTVVGLVATGAEVLVGAGGDGVGNVEVAAVHVAHVIAKSAHLIGKTRLVAIQTVALFMAGGAVDGAALGFGPVIHGPDRPVGFGLRKYDGGDIRLLVARKADRAIGRD